MKFRGFRFGVLLENSLVKRTSRVAGFSDVKNHGMAQPIAANVHLAQMKAAPTPTKHWDYQSLPTIGHKNDFNRERRKQQDSKPGPHFCQIRSLNLQAATASHKFHRGVLH